MSESLSVTARLVPFEPLSCSLEFDAKVEFEGMNLKIQYGMRGDCHSILFPKLSPMPKRIPGLWEHTCFEAFFTWKKNSVYWELNLSPSGDWNLYFFKGYRQGQVEEKRVVSLIQQQTQSCSKEWIQTVEIDIRSLFGEEDKVESGSSIWIGLSAVIEQLNQTKTYWAIRHTQSRPDFHSPDNFCLELSLP